MLKTIILTFRAVASGSSSCGTPRSRCCPPLGYSGSGYCCGPVSVSSCNVPPLDCDCGSLNLILYNPTLMVDGSGALEVFIIEQPVRQANSVCENGVTYWLWDYTVQYEDTLFVDPLKPLRNCDIKLACCDDCSTLFVKGKLRGYVETVTGNIVDNTDPNNPIVDETLTSLTAVGSDLSYTDEDGNVTVIDLCEATSGCGYVSADEICGIVTGCGFLLAADLCAAFAECGIATGVTSVTDLGDACEAFGENSMIRSMEVNGTTIEVVAAPEHTFGVYQTALADSSFNNGGIAAESTVYAPPINFSVIQGCRAQNIFITIDAGLDLILPEGWGGIIQLFLSVDGGVSTVFALKNIIAKTDREETFEIHSTIIDTLTAGVGRNYAFDLAVQCVTPLAGAEWVTFAYSARCCAGTT